MLKEAVNVHLPGPPVNFRIAVKQSSVRFLVRSVVDEYVQSFYPLSWPCQRGAMSLPKSAHVETYCRGAA